MIKLTVGGKAVRPGRFGDALMQGIVDQVAGEMRMRLETIRRPDTGEFPTVVVHGTSLDTPSFTVEGSPELLALVQERFGADEIGGLVLSQAARGASARLLKLRLGRSGIGRTVGDCVSSQWH